MELSLIGEAGSSPDESLHCSLVQEALNNVKKHARALSVVSRCVLIRPDHHYCRGRRQGLRTMI